MPENQPYVNPPYAIVVGVDYSELSDLAVERALELAGEKAHAALHLVHVLPVYQPGFAPEATVAGQGDTCRSLGEASARLLQHAEAALARHQARGKRPPERLVTHLRLDEPAEQIAQLAADLEADLVVVGTHGRRGVSRLLLGSVAEATVRLAPCPVLVVRPRALPPPAPRIEPPCPRCLQARKESGGSELWCEQHRERHGQRHTYYQSDRSAAETNLPLVLQR